MLFIIIKVLVRFFISYIISVQFFFLKSICRRYDNISDRCQEIPDTTKEIVELTKYLTDANTVQVVTLQNQVNEAAERLQFLLNYANLPGTIRICFKSLQS